MKKKKLIISIICIIVVLIVLFSVIAAQISSAATAKLFTNPNAKATDIDYEKDYSGDSTQNLSPTNNAGEGYVKKAETDSLELYLKVDNYKKYEVDLLTQEPMMLEPGTQRYDIAVYDKKAKKLWQGIVPDAKIDYENLNESLTAKMQSLVTFTYYDLLLNNNKANECNPLESGVNSVITQTDIPNGVRITYNMPELNIEFSVDFKINGDYFDVVVPTDLIKESVQDTSKIMEARNKAETKVSEYRKIIDKINPNKLKKDEDVTEDSIKILTDEKRRIEKDLMTLSDQGKSGGSTLSSVRELEMTSEQFFADLETYDKEGIYAEQLKRMKELNEEIAAAFEDVDSNTLAGLVSVNIMPYFGAAGNDENGYVFYPDKSGAISYFNVYHPDMVGFIEEDIYSNQKSDVATYSNYVSDSSEEEGTEGDSTNVREEFTTLQMPVFGIKNGNAAFLSIIAEGDTDAAINYTPANQQVKINNIYGIFHMRNITQNTDSQGTLSDVIDPDLIRQDRRIRYQFLAGEDADYAGMAVKYREHLEKHGLLSKSAYLDTDQLPLFVMFYMGMMNSSASVLPEYFPLTTYEQAQDILKDMRAKGINGNINTILSGWSTAANSVMPDYDRKPAGKIGGTSGLKDFTAFAAKNNTTVGLDNQYVLGRADDMTFNDKDVATTKNYGNFTAEAKGRHMFNPTVVYNRALESVAKFKTFGVNATTFAEEGRLVYNDYNKRAPYTRLQTKATMQKMVDESKKELGYAVVKDSNVYMAANADWFMDLMASDSRLLVSDEGVPFLQMVLHGSVIYTGQAHNMYYDRTVQNLKEIEYGYVPYYLLTADELDSLTNYSNMYSTTYSQWSDEIASHYKEYQQKVGDLWKTKMVDHQTIESGLVCVTYENGDKILINYNKTAKQYEGTTVEPEDYTVVRR